MNVGSFLESVRQAQFRFYQERDLGLDLYHNGWPGIVLGVLLVAVGVVFLLAIFHAIPARKHVTALLLGLGLAAALTGFATSYTHWKNFESLGPRIIRESAGPLPVTGEQRAAVVALPLVVGAGTLAFSCAGWLYVAVFWALSKRRDPS